MYNREKIRIYRARHVCTLQGPVIENGAVAVRGNHIFGVGRFEFIQDDFSGEMQDLGEVVLMPGLINAHCHLDYTDFLGRISPQKSFATWIQCINGHKRYCSDEDYVKAIRAGIAELILTGTTTVYNIEAFPQAIHSFVESPLRIYWFLELIDVRSNKSASEIVNEAIAHVSDLRLSRGGFGLSPHAPYTVSHELLERVRIQTDFLKWPLTGHLAESFEEKMMFEKGSGALAEFLAGLGRPMNDCGMGTSIQMWNNAGLLDSNFLAAHVNCVEESDLEIVSKHRLNIVHCPRSHSYFGHPRFLMEKLMIHGANICLGTDSLASNFSLSMFDEMRAMREEFPNLTPMIILRMATVHAARALNLEKELGTLGGGKLADMIAIAPENSSSEDVYETIVNHKKLPVWRMIDGQVLDEIR